MIRQYRLSMHSFLKHRLIRSNALLILYGITVSSITPLRSQEKLGDIVILRPTAPQSKDTLPLRGWEDLGRGLFRKSIQLLSYTGPIPDETVVNEPDPFLPGNPTAVRKGKSPEEILTAAGIKFAEGTSAVYVSTTSTLTVVQTADQIDAVESYFAGITQGFEKHINIRVEVFEVTPTQGMQVVQSAQSEGEHSPERAALMKAVEDGRVKLIAFPSVICRSGQRGLIVEGLTQGFPAKPSEANSLKPGSEIEDRAVPISKLEADCVLGADEITIDVNLSFTLSEAVVDKKTSTVSGDPAYRQWTVTTQATLQAGNHMLVGNWSSGGETMRLVFVSGHIQEVGRQVTASPEVSIEQ